MRYQQPEAARIPALRCLWKEAFGDEDAFLDAFFSVAFSPDRSLCAVEEEKILAALYWFDVTCHGERWAYLYAVATAERHRGKGICAQLMRQTHALLKERGYAGTILVPAGEALGRMYAAFGYRYFGSIRECSVAAGEKRVSLVPLEKTEYARLRRLLLPEDAVIQEGESLAFLASQAAFYAGDGFLLAAIPEGDKLVIPELLGDVSQAPAIVRSLGFREGTFCTPGAGKQFAMYHSLREEAAPPAYFGFAFC